MADKYVVVNKTVNKVVDFGKIISSKHSAIDKRDSLNVGGDVCGKFGEKNRYSVFKLKEVV